MSLLLIEESAGGSGPDQGVIEQARSRQRRRRVLGAAVIAALGMVVAGLLAGITGGGASHKSLLRLPPEPPLQTRHLPMGSISVQLSPNLEGGQAGWCVTIFERSGGSSGTCGPLPTFGHPLLAGTSGWTHGDSYLSTVEVTAPRVAYFLVNGTQRVATETLPGLPYGLRVAVIHTPFPRSVRRSLAALTTRSPTLIPLDADGKPIAESSDYGAVWFRDWNPPAAPLKGPCELRVSGLSGVTAEWGQIATAIRPYPSPIVGRGFLSCMDTEYYLAGARRGIRASVLLDAANPGKRTPAPIPGMATIPRLPGLYNAGPRHGFRGEPMTAKRQGNMWIVASGGGPNAQQARVQLLEHLIATVTP